MSGGKGSMGQLWSLGYLEPKLQWSLMETSYIGIWLDNQCHACGVWLPILGSTFQPQKIKPRSPTMWLWGLQVVQIVGRSNSVDLSSWLLECLVHLDLAISTWCKCCDLNLKKWVSYRSEKKQILTWSLVFNAWTSQTLASILAASFIVATFQLCLPVFDVGGAEWRTCHVDLPLNVHYKMVRLDSACVHSGVFVRLNMLSIFFQVNGRSLLSRSLHDARGDHESSRGNAWCLVFAVQSWS